MSAMKPAPRMATLVGGTKGTSGPSLSHRSGGDTAGEGGDWPTGGHAIDLRVEIGFDVDVEAVIDEHVESGALRGHVEGDLPAPVAVPERTPSGAVPEDRLGARKRQPDPLLARLAFLQRQAPDGVSGSGRLVEHVHAPSGIGGQLAGDRPRICGESERGSQEKQRAHSTSLT